MGEDHALLYFNDNNEDGTWVGSTIAGKGTTYSPPAIAMRSDGEVDVVAQGPSHSLMYYHAATFDSAWDSDTIAGSGTTYSAPAIAVDSASGTADVVASSDNNMIIYWATPGSTWNSASGLCSSTP